MERARGAGFSATHLTIHRRETFANRRILFLWAFAALFLVLTATVSVMLIHDSVPGMRSSSSLVGILTAIWIVTIGLTVFAASRPCTTVTVVAGAGLQIRWRFPFRSGAREIRFEEVSLAFLVESWAGDGVPYFYARVDLSDGARVNLTEGPDRRVCVATCNRFNTTLLEHLAIPPPPS